MIGRRLLVAGIGNVFFGDDGFGVEVARRLGARPQPEGVRIADFGIRGIDLAYALTDGVDAAILIDAVPRGGAPGTLYVLEPDVRAAPAGTIADTHRLDPSTVLGLLCTLGDHQPVVRLVGCEPSAGSDDEMMLGLSAPVAAAVDEAVTLVEALVAELRDSAVGRA
jgi:hydrogenase maturation protease